jgi:hypothetical protein
MFRKTHEQMSDRWPKDNISTPERFGFENALRGKPLRHVDPWPETILPVSHFPTCLREVRLVA